MLREPGAGHARVSAGGCRRTGAPGTALRWEPMIPPPRIVTADRGDAGRRLDLVLRRHLADVETATRARVQTWIADGKVTVNGRAVHRVAARAALGDVVTIVLPGGAVRGAVAAE